MFITNKRLNTEQTIGKEHFAKREVGFMGQEGWQINLPIIKSGEEAIFLAPSAASCPPSLLPFLPLPLLRLPSLSPFLSLWLVSITPGSLFYYPAHSFQTGSIFFSLIHAPLK